MDELESIDLAHGTDRARAPPRWIHTQILDRPCMRPFGMPSLAPGLDLASQCVLGKRAAGRELPNLGERGGGGLWAAEGESCQWCPGILAMLLQQTQGSL